MPLRPKLDNGKELISPAGIDILRMNDTKRKLGYDAFPFSCKLSFVPLINHWKKKISAGDAGEVLIAREITKRLDQAMEFLTPFDNLDEISEQRHFVELLLTGIFPSARRDQDLAFARKPFDPAGFYFTRPFLELFTKEGISLNINNEEGVRNATILRACRMILNQFYGQRIRYDEETIVSIKTTDSPYEKHYKLELNTKFVEIKKLHSLKTISQQDINMLLSDINDIDLWLSFIPPHHFEFQGMVSVTLIDVTEREAMSRLRKSLLNKDAVVDPDKILELEHELRKYFRINSLVMGLVAVDYPELHKLPLRYKINHSLLEKKGKKIFGKKYTGSIYERACREGQTLIIEDLETYALPTEHEKHLLKCGIRSIVIIPLLRSNQQVIGILELGSPKAYDLNPFVERKLSEVIPLFRTVMRRSRQEIDNEIEAIIREEYTALHQSVEWKFVDAAFKLATRRKTEGAKAIAKPIVFKEVYALYGQADIVGSTFHRNQVVQADFLDNLERVKKLLQQIRAIQAFPIVEGLIVRVNNEIQKVKNGIVSDQEFRLANIIKKEIHPFLLQFKGKNAQLDLALNEYFALIDDDLQLIYDKRKEYEESIRLINQTIGNYLDKEEKNNQEMLPHYFEKYKTDGVEYNIFIGQSLLKQKQFEKIHLQNLRLWQLLSMCEIARTMQRLQNRLPHKLNTAQLILVHSTPLNIRFRLDEKQFDVDGTLDIRYPLLKKRIDKALIEGTQERLTQEGKIAIVYVQEQDREEYMNYLDILQQKGLITEDIEFLKLEDMQGVHGLRAIRISVIGG